MNEVRLNGRQMYSEMPKETVPCSLCGAKEFKKILDRDRYGMGVETVFCERCGFIFTNPRPTQEAMNRFYRETYRQFYTGSPLPERDYTPESSRYERAERIFKNTLPHLAGRKSPAVLDIGCGSGVLLNFFRNHFPESRLYGIEPDPVFSRYAAEKNRASVHDEDLESLFRSKSPFPEPLDVVVLNQVLEHLYDPFQKLLQIREWMADDARIVVEVPDLTSSSWKDPLKIFHIAHISHFAPHTLKRALEDAGFEVVYQASDSARAMTAIARKRPGKARGVSDAPADANEMKKLSARLRAITDNLAGISAAAMPWEHAVRFAKRVHKRLPLRGVKRAIRRWTRDSAKNRDILRKSLEGQRVIVLSAGPSAWELAALPEDAKLLCTHAALKIMADRDWRRPIDLFLCMRGKLERNPAIAKQLAALGARLFVTNDPDFVVSDRALKGRAEQIAFDNDDDNFYVKRLASSRERKALYADGKRGTSDEVRLVQLALHYGANEIYLSGVDLGDKGYYGTADNVERRDGNLDAAFLRFAAVRYGKLYSLSGNSPIARLVPHKNPWETVPA